MKSRPYVLPGIPNIFQVVHVIVAAISVLGNGPPEFANEIDVAIAVHIRHPTVPGSGVSSSVALDRVVPRTKRSGHRVSHFP
jgi:hypothetical protein